MKNDTVQLPAREIPTFRTFDAIRRGKEKNFLLKTWGGLGDQICAEPTLRFALDTFKGCEISLASEVPELFGHLRFKRVYDLKTEKPDENDYFVFDTISTPDRLTWEFFSHCVTNCVDFPALCAFRSQLPVSYRHVQLQPHLPSVSVQNMLLDDRTVILHPGKHWPTKTFPAEWWNRVIDSLWKQDCMPVIIGGSTEQNPGTVTGIETDHAVDLRCRLTVSDSIWLLQNAKALITNDSSPLHMAASHDPRYDSGKAMIHYVATCKHPDFISHFRFGEWAWRMKNHGLGGIWETLNHCPNQEETVQVDQCTAEQLESWLPVPESMVEQVAAQLW